MQWGSKRQAAIAVLALCLVLMLGRTAWMQRVDARAQSQLAAAGKWLHGIVIVVDPGHGGEDPGAVVSETREKDLVLEISMKVKETLQQQGATVVLTRQTDTSLGGPIREELGRRVALIEQHRAQVFVSIHANKDSCLCWGAQTFFQRKGMPAGQRLAMTVQNQMRKWTPTTRTALPADYFVLRNSSAPAAMIEVGFLSNGQEKERLQNPDYQQTLATAITIGIADFLRGEVPPARAGATIGR